MKKFCIVSLLLLLALRAMACISGPSTYNYYMFCVYPDLADNGGREAEMARQLAQTWTDYVGRLVTVEQSEALADLRPADIDTTSHPVVSFARKRGDREMLDYLRLLASYMEVAADNDPWYYPTEAEIQTRSLKLRSLCDAAATYAKPRLAARYRLLEMRAAFRLNDYARCIAVWEQNEPLLPQGVFRTMMRGYYAGALLHTGRREEACATYAELGDSRSARFCMRTQRNLSCIRAAYQRDPNAAVLPFMVQDFVNNAQETLDNEAYRARWQNEYQGYYRTADDSICDVYEQEVRDFIDFATQVVGEGKSRSLAMWQSAAALLHFLYGEYGEAQREIDAAMSMTGNKGMRENARAIRLLISTATAADQKTYEVFLIPELLWLNSKLTHDDPYVELYSNHFERARQRIVRHGLVPLYERWGQHEMATALTAYVDYYVSDWRKLEADNWNWSYAGNFFHLLDTMPIPRLEAFYDFMFNEKRKHTVLENWLLGKIYTDTEYYADIIGTRHLRAGHFEQAQAWLWKVGTDFLSQQNIASYVEHRHYTYAAWLQRQPLPEGLQYRRAKVHNNRKLQFCRDVITLRDNYAKSRGERHCQWAYNLAVLYYQASIKGECWWLARYGKSVNDTLKADDFDFMGEAHALLREVAKNTTDKSFKSSSLYGMALMDIEPWYAISYEWEPRFREKKEVKPGQQYDDLNALADYAAKNDVPHYISSCDVLKDFLRATR